MKKVGCIDIAGSLFKSQRHSTAYKTLVITYWVTIQWLFQQIITKDIFTVLGHFILLKFAG